MRCGAEENEVRLFDAIYEGRMGSMCERCSIIENIPIIRKPNSIQLKEAENTIRVYQRMKNLAGIYDKRKEETFFPEDRLKELDLKPELERPVRQNLNLVDHYYWEIMKLRRRRGLSQKQLAEAIGESEVVINMIEKEKLPDNADSVIIKLEQMFQRKFRKITETERILMERRSKPVLLDVEGNELEIIPEESEAKKEEPRKIKGFGDYYKDFLGAGRNKKEEKKVSENIEIEEFEEMTKTENMDLDLREEAKNQDSDFNIRAVDKGSVRIADLRDMHRKKVDALKEEKIKEQKSIEQHKMLVEARKEELRLKREKESKELDNILGGKELVDKKKKE